MSITLTIDEAAALKTWTSQQQAVEKLKKKLSELEVKKDPLAPLQAGALKAGVFLKDALVSIVGIGTALGGVMAFASQLKAEYENIKSRQQGAATTNIDFSKELSRGIRATGGSVTAQEFEAMVNAGSKSTGHKPITVAQAYNAAFTALGPRNKQEVQEGTATADAVLQQYADEDPQTIKQLIAVTAQNRRVFGLTDQQSLGYQQKAQNMSFVKDVAAFATNVAGKLSAVSKSGDFTAAESGSLTGALSQAGGDLEGATSTMAALTFGAELKERLPFIPTGAGRIQYMQQNPAEAEAYFSGGMIGGKEFAPAETGRSIYKPHIRDLFNSKSQVATEYEKNKQAYGGAADWEREAASMRKEVQSVRSVQVTNAQRAVDTGGEQLQIQDTAGAIAAVTRTGLADTLKKAGESDLAQKISAMSFEYNTSLGTQGPVEQMASELDRRARPLRSTKTTVLDAATGVEEEYDKSPQQLFEDKQKADSLDQMRQTLLRANEDIQKARILQQAEPALGQLRESKAKYEAGGMTPEERAAEDAKVSKATREVQALTRQTTTSGTASNELLTTMDPLIQAINALKMSLDKNTDTTGGNNRATEDNTKAQPKPGTTATPRPVNVTALQNARR